MDEAWYIDALDGLSGLAFASYRTADLTDDMLELTGPAWAISAPGFEPEPVASRAIGMAATHRGAQFGLSVDGTTEVAFPSLDALAEFVRRLFLSGGGSDGSGGVVPPDGGPPSPPEDGETETETDASEPLMPYRQVLAQFAEAMMAASGQLITDEKTAMELTKIADPGFVAMTGGAGGPMDAADAIISEYLARIWNTTPGEDVETVHALSIAVEGYLTLAATVGIQQPRPEIMSLFGTGHRSFEHAQLRDDVLDILAQIPIPAHVCRSSNGQEDWRSLKDLFYGILANPDLLLSGKCTVERAALFLFAAAAMFKRGSARSATRLRGPSRHMENRILMIKVFDWLRPQLPRFCYTPALEDMIRGMHRPVMREDGAE